MININFKVLIVTILVIFSFFNNVLLGFENLRTINEDLDQECFLQTIDASVKVEKPFIKNVKIIYHYIIFYLFFYDIENPTSIIPIINYA